MLHRSFKPAKCKTALKLAVSRIKLLNNKREVQIRQIKKELAQLLEAGQIQTARIRVEHVVREEKAMTAYNLIEIYCELIAARLPIIESQKTCPIDLKEAITSVIFASPRCSDVPELADIKKQLTAKYGKELVSNAIELRPDCGVNRMLVEKLSAKAPDGQTKLKILIDIAEEHNVKWNPDSFSESDTKPPQDLLHGPNTFETASKIFTEAPPVPTHPVHDDRAAPPNAQVPPSYKGNEQNTRPSSSTAQNFATPTTSASFHSEEQSSGSRTEKFVEHKQSYRQNVNSSSSSSSLQDWSMQFKDATSAAQAAAESAERASMAARAAAELSQRSSESPRSHGYAPSPKTESPKSYGYGPKDESPKIYAGSKLQSDLASKGAESDSLNRRNLGRRDERIVDKEREEPPRPTERVVSNVYKNDGMDKKAASPKFSTASSGYSQKSSSKSYENEYFEGRSKKKNQSDEVSGFEEKVTRTQSSGTSRHSHSQSSSFGDDQEKVSRKNSDIPYFEETKTKKQSSRSSSRSHSSASIDIHEDIFKRNDDNKNTASFDDYGSDNDDHKVNLLGSKEQETSSYFSPPSREPPINLSADSTVWSPRRNTDEGLQKPASQFHPSIFAQSLEVSSPPPQPDDLPPAAFDDYDSPSSDSEEEDPVKTKPIESEDLRKVPSEKTVQQTSEDTDDSEGENFEPPRRNHGLRSSTVDPLPMQQEVPDRKTQGIKSKPLPEDSELYDFSKDSELLSESSSESGNELNFGSLRGGLRNKGLARPPYMRKSSRNSSKAKDETEDACSDVGQSSTRSPTVRPPLDSDPSAGKQEMNNTRHSLKQSKKTSVRTLPSRVDSDDENMEEVLQQDTRLTRPSFNQKSGVEVNKRPSPRTTRSYFDSDNSDAEEDASKSMNARSGPALLSRRTKVSSPYSGRSHSKPTVLSEESTVSKIRSESNPSPTSFSVGETSPKTYAGRADSRTARQFVAPSYGTEGKLSSRSSRVNDDPLPMTSGRTYPIKTSVESAAPDYGFDSKSPSSSSNVDETLSKNTTGRAYSKTSYRPESKSSLGEASSTKTPTTEPKSSDQVGTRERRRLVEQVDSPRSNPEPRRSSPHMEQKPNSPPKSAKSDASEIPKINVQVITRENSSNDKASHVHPNLPDSDSFTAFFQSLRKPRE